MTASAIAQGEYDLPQRNQRAAYVIESHATFHAGADAAIGLGGTCLGMFMPFGGTAAMVASLVAQIPVYRSLARELGVVYEAALDSTARRILLGGVAFDAVATVGADLAVSEGQEFLAAELSTAFIQEIARELVGEYLAGLALSAIPIIGGFVAMGLDIVIARRMTWRVGLMICAYFQNGRRWPGGSRRSALDAVMPLPEGTAPDDLRNHIPDVREYQVEQAVLYVRRLLRLAPDATRDTICALLRDDEFPDDLAETAIQRVFGSP